MVMKDPDAFQALSEAETELAHVNRYGVIDGLDG